VPGPKYHRIALAQISYNPAYIDDSGISYLHEPIFPSEPDRGLHKIAGITEIHELRLRIATNLINHLSRKISAVIEFAAASNAEVIVLPEYSVPHELLAECMALARRLNIAIIAGSHIATRPALAEHARLGIVGALGETRLGRAVCPVFMPDGTCHLFEKITRSKWESALVPGLDSGPITMSLDDEQIVAEVLICIDAVQEQRDRKGHRVRGTPTITFMPSLTPSAELFYKKAELLLASGRVTMFANIAEFGGSRVFARAERATGWKVTSDGTHPLPKNSEAIIIAEVDLSHQFDVRKSTQEHFPVREIGVVPLVYAEQSDASTNYLGLVSTIEKQSGLTAEALGENLKGFVALDYRLFPQLMQEKISHFLTSVLGPGLGDERTWLRWLTPVAIRSTSSLDMLRWNLCSDAIEQVNELTLSGKYPDKTDLLAETWKYLVNKRNELRARTLTPTPMLTVPLKSGPDEPLSAAGTVGSFEPPFFDRETMLGALQNFLNSPERSCFVLSGMRGIGKTSLAREAFKKVIPPNWLRLRISLTEGASYPRLLAEFAHQLGLRVPGGSSLDSPAKIIDLEQNLLLYFSHTPRLAVLLDDFQYLIEPNGEFSDPNAQRFVSQLIEVASARRNKIFVVTNHFPKLGDSLRPFVEPKPIGGLEKKDSENLYSYWFRFERPDLGDAPISFPDKLLGVLRGNPLGVKVAARLVAESTAQKVESDTAIFKRLRETVITFLLDQVELAAAEDELIRFASIFRLPVGRDVFVAWKGDQANFLLDSLLGRSFLEADGEDYILHPIIRDHFYTTTSIEVLRPFHRAAGGYFLQRYKKVKTDANPDLLGEAIHHYLCAGDREKVKEFALYKYELEPVARMHYRKRDFELALREYRVLIALAPSDVDAHFHLALLYAWKNDWDKAEAHFGKAIHLKPSAYWILQGYGHAKMRAGHTAEAEQLFFQALEINPRHSPTLTDLARLHARRRDEISAESYFKQAIESDPNNAFAYREYALFLLHTRRFKEGLEMALAAAETDPREQRNRDLVVELRGKIDSASKTIEGAGDSPSRSS
jgi:Tfp pilus assembly protein PilF